MHASINLDLPMLTSKLRCKLRTNRFSRNINSTHLM